MAALKRPRQAKFSVTLEDGRVARCWRAIRQPYLNCEFSAGLVDGLGVDTLYVSWIKDGEDEPHYLFLRPDEMLAFIRVMSGAMWSEAMLQLNDGAPPRVTWFDDDAKN